MTTLWVVGPGCCSGNSEEKRELPLAEKRDEPLRRGPGSIERSGREKLNGEKIVREDAQRLHQFSPSWRAWAGPRWLASCVSCGTRFH